MKCCSRECHFTRIARGGGKHNIMMLVHEGLPEGEMLHGNIYDAVHEGLPERGNVAR